VIRYEGRFVYGSGCKTGLLSVIDELYIHLSHFIFYKRRLRKG
jgi:hypothetical protein